jgi:transcription elongation factor GreB
MPRWKPPPPKSSPYITPEGAKALEVELKELWKLRRRDVVPALSAAAAEGDRSENAEYIYRKKQLGEIDRRVRYLSKRLDAVEIVDRTPADRERVFFSAWIELEDQEGEQVEYRIVGADETDAARGYISIDSPLARALLGRRVDDAVEVELPDSSRSYVLLSIRYT